MGFLPVGTSVSALLSERPNPRIFVAVIAVATGLVRRLASPYRAGRPIRNRVVFGASLMLASLAHVSMPTADAQVAPRFSIWDVRIGEPLSQIPEREIVDLACGTNGGPPSRPLDSLSDFHVCNPEENSLREVYFRYDDELEYRAKALELIVESRLYAGTTVYGHPVIISALVDASGIVQGVRVISDPRAALNVRRRAVALHRFIKARFGEEWRCIDRYPREGETPLGGIYLNTACKTVIPGQSNAYFEAHFFRKKGQTPINRSTGQVNRAQFESTTRFEILRLPYQSLGSETIP